VSGIVGILRTDGAPFAPAVIEGLIEGLPFQGEDGRGLWHGGRVALGHTPLASRAGALIERQPLSVGEDVWIVADARIDAREELITRLDGDAHALGAAPDVELILRAYLRWGDACVGRLIGDFSFVVWDARTRLLFCARDHMGVKPFYFATCGTSSAFPPPTL
jgi:asparagine synthase (glutamine-hydrolysing)